MLSKSTGERVWAHAIVALPGWFVLPSENAIDVKVLSGKQVASEISSMPAALSTELIEQITYQLDQRCRTVEF
jgi:hypothetical protein